MSPSGDDPRVERSVDLTEEQVAILSGELVGRLADAAVDLAYLDRSPDPFRDIREVAAWGRLVRALEGRRITLPDPEAARLFRGLAEAIAEGDGHDQVLAVHGALVAFLEVLG